MRNLSCLIGYQQGSSSCSPLIGTQPSVAIFGEICPLWQNGASLWQFFEGLRSIWRNFEPHLVIF